MREPIGVGVLGCGIVGSAVVRALVAGEEQISERAGGPLAICRVAVRNLARERDVPVPKTLFTNDAREVVSDPRVAIVVEVIGGIEPARSLILEAMKLGKFVVSANKELISTLGGEILDAASRYRVGLGFEASVGGAIPIIRPLIQSLAGERITEVVGIVNGTTNFILTRMSEQGLEFDQALAEAERLGYTELDPSADIEGFDPAAKIAILASLAFNARVVAGDVYREGITGVTQRDIAFARSLGYSVKMLAVAEDGANGIGVRVHPAMVPLTHPLASVRDNLNAVFVRGEGSGELMFYGRGAGGPPSASAVIGDLIDAARTIRDGGFESSPSWHMAPATIRPMEDTRSQYYLLLEVIDRPGVLARVAGVFASNDVSIKSVWQEGFGEEARLVMVTHEAGESNFQAVVSGLRGLEVVEEVASAMRVFSEEH